MENTEAVEIFVQKFGEQDLHKRESMRRLMFYRAIVAIGDCIKHGDCWVYPKLDSSGYGSLSVGGRTTTVSRLVLCCATNKPLGYKEGKEFMEACHRTPLCRYRACCNPEHLFWDSKSNNAKRRETERAAREVAKLMVSGLISGASTEAPQCIA